MVSMLLLLALPFLAAADYKVVSLFSTADCTLSATATPAQQQVTYTTTAACSSSDTIACTSSSSIGRTGYYTQKCVTSALTLPDTDSLSGVAEYSFASCTGGMSSSAMPALSTATSMTTSYSPTCASGSLVGMTGYYKFQCGAWGLAQLLYTDSACTNLTNTIALSESFNQCNNATLNTPADDDYYKTVFSDLSPPSSQYRAVFSDAVVCSSAGCNSPASDACALATSPVVASVVLSGMPASAQDSSGKLTTAGLGVVQASITAAVQSSACSTCSATVTQVLDTSSGTVVYAAPAARRLAFGALAVTFSVTGASAGTLALVAAAAASPAFLAATTKELAANGYTSVSATAAPSSAPAPGPPLATLGLLGLLALLVVGPALWCWCARAKAKAAVAAKPEPSSQA